MGLVYQFACPVCKKKAYIASHVARVTCPECKEGIIVNPKAKLVAPRRPKEKKHVFIDKDETKTTTCSSCNINFTTPPSLFRGKVYCPSCGAENKIEGVQQI